MTLPVKISLVAVRLKNHTLLNGTASKVFHVRENYPSPKARAKPWFCLTSGAPLHSRFSDFAERYVRRLADFR